MSIAILWPAPCLPALLTGTDTELDLIATRERCSDSEVAAWSAGLRLRDTTNDQRRALTWRSLTPLTLSETPEHAHAAAALAVAEGLDLVRIRLGVGHLPKPDAPRRARLFDIVSEQAVLRARAVATRHAGDGVLRIAFASDLHVASLWDDIAEAIARHAPALRGRLLHPQELLERMIAELEILASRGELDVLVLGGDLVDYVYRDRLPAAGVDGTNLPLLLERVARLGVPVFAIPGNHDYRLYPWRPRVYPFTGAGLPQSEAERAMRLAGMWGAWPLHRHDLEALQTDEADGRPALRHHLRGVAPATDFTVDIDDLRLIFMATGRDILPRWRTVERGRLGMLARSIPVSYHHPDCEGLSESQIAALRTALDGCRSAALFFHAPLLNPMPGVTVDAHLDRLEPDDDSSLPARIRFERHLFSTGMRHGVFFRNPALFVRTIRSFNGSLTAFSGHVHGTHAFELEPRTGAARSVAVAQATGNGDAHTLLNAPALGQTATRDGEPPGYLLARFDGGRLTAMHRPALFPL
jgi:hypothetical protein